MERAVELLKACEELLSKQEESPYVLDMLAEMVTYDGIECDGSCLLDDIRIYFESGV